MSTPDTAPAAAGRHVVIYSAAEQQYCAGLLAGFRALHPDIEVDFVFGISVALHQRYLAELAADRPIADVLWSSAMDLQMELVRDGHALPHRSPEAGALPHGAAYRDLAWATTVEPLMTLVNRDLYDTRMPAGSLAELTAALRSAPDRFHRRVACYDIERNGLGFLALLYECRRSAEFDAFLQALAACKPRMFRSNPELVAEVATGRAALGYHVLGSYALRAVREHPSVAVAASAAAPLAVSRVAFISKRAPHPVEARLFLDYLLSADGQRRLGEAGLYPLRQERDTAAAVVDPIPIDLGFDDLLDPQCRQKLLSRWSVIGSLSPS